jgi:hypothetical protein
MSVRSPSYTSGYPFCGFNGDTFPWARKFSELCSFYCGRAVRRREPEFGCWPGTCEQDSEWGIQWCAPVDQTAVNASRAIRSICSASVLLAILDNADSILCAACCTASRVSMLWWRARLMARTRRNAVRRNSLTDLTLQLCTLANQLSIESIHDSGISNDECGSSFG